MSAIDTSSQGDRSGPAAIRPARRADLPQILALLVEDGLGRARDDASLPLDPCYPAAFDRIDGNPDHLMLVLEEAGRIAGYLQLSFIPGLSRRGMTRGHIEAVRIASDRRGRGLGRRLFEGAIAECRRRQCGLVQLTTDKARADARRFYEGLGFEATHEGMKLVLQRSRD
jgi:ribosomal protein S18 acetylase RimI-like enzyme